MSKQYSKSFTLIELLVVLALIAILSTVLILIIKPGQIFSRARDTKRINDLKNIEKIMDTLYATDQTFNELNYASSNVVYISLPDNNTNCSNWLSQLPSLPSGWSYRCSANPTNIDGSGWIPIPFNSFPILNISQLPIDPRNQPPYYYSFVVGGSYAVYAQLEDPKNQASKNDGDNYPHLFSAGNNKRLIDQAQGLVDYWPFDEGSGTIAKDYSGNGNTLTIGAIGSNVIWDSGKIGAALNYLPSAKTATTPCPTGAYLSSISSGPIYNLPQGNYTFIAFVKLSAGGTIARFNTQYSIPGCCNGHWHLDYRHFIAKSDSTNGGIMHGSLPIDNQWHQYAYVFDLSSNIQKAFTDGVQTNSGSLTGSFGNISKINFGIYDTSWCGAGHAITGLIDEVRIYNRALSDAEIQALYNATK